MTDYSYLKEEEGQESKDALAKLKELVATQDALMKEIEQTEARLSALKASLQLVSGEEIPNLLAQNNLSEIKLADGRKVTVKRDLSASISDMAAFKEFLVARGDAEILKWNLDFGRVDENTKHAVLRAVFDASQLSPAETETVHPQTLKKYLKELTGFGTGEGGSIPLSSLPECVKVYTYFKTVIK